MSAANKQAVSRMTGIKDGFDPFMLMLCSLSISIMPHLLSDSLQQISGVTLNSIRVEKIFWQNTQMIQFGCMKQQQVPIHD